MGHFHFSKFLRWANVSASFAYSKEMDPYRDGVPYSIQQKWNKHVLDMFELFLKYNVVVDRLTVLGLNDAGTWLNGFPIRVRKDYPVLFDRKNNSKSVVDDMTIMTNKYKSKK